MRFSVVAVLVTAILSVAAGVATWFWLRTGPEKDVGLRAPFPVESIPRFIAELPGVLTTGEGEPAAAIEGSWPGFRGPGWDGISWEEVKLLEAWPESGPERLWSVDLGEGYAGPAIHRGRVYVMDYDEGRIDGEVVPERRGDALRCLSLADGKEIWRRWYHLPMVRSHGISRTTPAVTDRYVVSLGPMGHVLCVDATTGAAKWSLDLVEQFGAVIPEWYAAQCPRIDVIDGVEAAVLAPGGNKDVLMLAVACETGEVLWRTPNPRNVNMTHSSIAWMEWQGKATYVYCTTGGVVGVAAADGELVWEFRDWTISPAIVPAPVILDGGRMLLSGGYKSGSRLVEIRADEGGRPEAVEIARFDPRTFAAEQQTPIAYQGCIYGVLTKNGGPRREQLTCLSAEGAVPSSSGPERLFELGPFLVADDKLLLMNDTGVLTMARHSRSGYEELARAEVMEADETWGPMAIAGGLLLVRDLHTMICLDLRDPARRGGR